MKQETKGQLEEVAAELARCRKEAASLEDSARSLYRKAEEVAAKAKHWREQEAVHEAAFASLVKKGAREFAEAEAAQPVAEPA